MVYQAQIFGVGTLQYISLGQAGLITYAVGEWSGLYAAEPCCRMHRSDQRSVSEGKKLLRFEVPKLAPR